MAEQREAIYIGWLSKDNGIELEGSKHEVRKEPNRGRQGWLNEDNEIELQGSNEDEIGPGESKKQLSRRRLGWRVRENILEPLGHTRDKSLDTHMTCQKLVSNYTRHWHPHSLRSPK